MHISSINKYILDYFCSACGSLFKSKNGLCPSCERILLKSLEPLTFPHPSIKYTMVRSLINWKKDESEIKNRLMMMLKGDKSIAAWSFWTQIFISQHRLFKGLDETTLFIPIVAIQLDHSYFFAKALADQLGAEISTEIRQFKTLTSKKLSKKGRQSKRSKFYINDMDQFKKFKRIVVVDDILTTGETTAALLEQIDHENKEVWVIAHRELSCD